MRTVASSTISVAAITFVALISVVSTAGTPRQGYEIKDEIKNGRYTAVVQFKNPKTRKIERRKVQVMVESDRIVMINLGNGETVHAGYNNSGYGYRGGYLSFERDWSADIIIAAEATVTLTMKTGDVYKLELRIAP